MILSDTSERGLLVGRETGPIAEVIKRNYPKIKLGSVDILGNLETRKYSDWSFSVERQISNQPLHRKKHRSLLDLIEGLTAIIMEEHDFDFFLPLTLMQKNPDLIVRLTKKMKTEFIRRDLLEISSSGYSFLKNILKVMPELLEYPESLLNAKSQINQQVVITPHQMDIKNSIFINDNPPSNSFILPYVPVYCMAFIRTNEILNYIGMQRVVPPLNKELSVNAFEKNGLIPANSVSESNIARTKEVFQKLINVLNLFGIITIYFGLLDSLIVPYKCNLLPDENFDLWNVKSSHTLCRFLLTKNKEKILPVQSNYYAFKLPIYLAQSIKVPKIMSSIATQRNIPGTISMPKYPLCSIFGYANTLNETKQILREKKQLILKNLNFNMI
ncbi:MAG: hypothetical protein EAX86_07400 [Candidatus Heimdallarchaeota archaeon]|nr:hypothetical protein [Candidatus Heimdallarchaeota archaeon]